MQFFFQVYPCVSNSSSTQWTPKDRGGWCMRQFDYRPDREVKLVGHHHHIVEKSPEEERDCVAEDVDDFVRKATRASDEN